MLKLSSHKESAFTLVELAIVIVIIGLLVGGVIQGQELIRQAEIQNYIKERSSIDSAIITYQGKYNNYPGDDSRASTWFGTDCTTEIATTGNPVACDGNNDKRVNNSEPVFVHLKLAKLLNGTYGAINATTTRAYQFNSKLKGMVWRIHTPAVPLFEQSNFSWLDITSGTDGGAFTPEEAMMIDQKTDDGNGSSGTVLAINGANGSCMSVAYSTGAAGSATFQTTINNRTCRIFSRINM